MEITFSIAQIKLDPESFEVNRDNTLYLIDQLQVTDNHFLLLPELWSTGFTSNLEQANKFNSDLLVELKIKARQKNIFIAGSYIVKQEDKTFSNQLILISPEGNIIVRYNKINLFFQLDEKILFSKGKNLAILKFKNLNIGFSICYDLRFPELYRTYAKNEVCICFLPAQWPTKRISHFSKLLFARAIENQMYMISANIVGKVKNTMFGGNSMIVDFMGEPVISLGEKENSVGTTKINTDLLFDWRKDFSVLADINLIDYKKIDYFQF